MTRTERLEAEWLAALPDVKAEQALRGLRKTARYVVAQVDDETDAMVVRSGLPRLAVQVFGWLLDIPVAVRCEWHLLRQLHRHG